MAGKQTLEQRFNAKVLAVGNVCECWIWTGAKVVGGYGEIWYGREKDVARASRVAWELTFGPIPDGLFVLHHCDNPPCVNPYHLFLGTHRENMADMRGKRRQSTTAHHAASRVYGSQNGAAKLSAEDVRAIRAAREAGVPLTAIAKRFGVGKTTVWNVARGATWAAIE